MSFQLVCNHKNCLKAISNVGWATACSHIFCEEHGSSLKLHWKSIVCPACGSRFEGQHSIIETRVSPSEEYKAMILSGLRPDVVLKIASNAIDFWMYQCQQEIKILRNKLDYYKSKLGATKTELEKNKVLYEKHVNKLQMKLNDADNKIKQLTLEVIEKGRTISYLQREQCGKRFNSSFR